MSRVPMEKRRPCPLRLSPCINRSLLALRRRAQPPRRHIQGTKLTVLTLGEAALLLVCLGRIHLGIKDARARQGRKHIAEHGQG